MTTKFCVGLVFVLITGTITSISLFKMQTAELKSLRHQLTSANAQLKEYQHAKQIDNDVNTASDSVVADRLRQLGYITD